MAWSDDYLYLLKTTNAQYKLVDAFTDREQEAHHAEIKLQLATLGADWNLNDWVSKNVLSAAQVGNGNSTNTYDHGYSWLRAGALIRLTTAIGATPTCTYALQGSPDNANWSSLTYADSATLTTFTTATFVITTAVTVMKYIPPGQPYRYFRLLYSLNTNVTNTADIVDWG